MNIYSAQKVKKILKNDLLEILAVTILLSINSNEFNIFFEKCINNLQNSLPTMV